VTRQSINLKGDLPLIWRLSHSGWRIGKRGGFNLAGYLEISFCSAVILATFCVGIAAYAGTIQPQIDVPPAQSVRTKGRLFFLTSPFIGLVTDPEIPVTAEFGRVLDSTTATERDVSPPRGGDIETRTASWKIVDQEVWSQ
jgi:hypothetical protein